ncbi:hypothetical protein K1W54_04935 [Micromonospora sp. CPCC 205371]|nr:hypothetical protein [Micromonospora sp. CPCC 205371]
MTLSRKTPLRSTKPLAPMSERRLMELKAAGLPVNSTLVPRQRANLDRQPRSSTRRDTGPTVSTTKLLHRRSGKVCEWPGCVQPATEKHHRLNRKSGGRHGEARERVNGVAWLLHACHTHHAYVTSPFGERRQRALAMGWLLTENQDALRVPVLTRHDDEPVWLDAEGMWHLFEVGVA